ncbi:MAG: archease [Methylocystis sp.]|nr:archease [Methylocystis sp.]
MTQQKELFLAKNARWEHFPHGADIGVRGYGSTPSIAFEQAALAMCAAIADLSTVRQAENVSIECAADSLDFLLLDWLNALIYEMAQRNMVFSAFRVEIDDDALKARALGEHLSRERHAPAVEVKGATFTELAVVEDAPGLWRAQCVVDV